jgi:hypothetical protein
VLGRVRPLGSVCGAGSLNQPVEAKTGLAGSPELFGSNRRVRDKTVPIDRFQGGAFGVWTISNAAGREGHCNL